MSSSSSSTKASSLTSGVISVLVPTVTGHIFLGPAEPSIGSIIGSRSSSASVFMVPTENFCLLSWKGLYKLSPPSSSSLSLILPPCLLPPNIPDSFSPSSKLFFLLFLPWVESMPWVASCLCK